MHRHRNETKQQASQALIHVCDGFQFILLWKTYWETPAFAVLVVVI